MKGMPGDTLMDDVARFNKERWEELAAANCTFCRPWLDLDARSAPERVDPAGMLGDAAGKETSTTLTRRKPLRWRAG